MWYEYGPGRDGTAAFHWALCATMVAKDKANTLKSNINITAPLISQPTLALQALSAHFINLS